MTAKELFIFEDTMRLPHHHPYSLDTSWSAGAVLLGAGQGERLGHGPKALIELGGKTLLLHALEAMASNQMVSAIAVTAPTDMRCAFEEIVSSANLNVPVLVVPGGSTRQASTHAGITALAADLEWLAITDIARPFTPHGTVDHLLDHLRRTAERSDGTLRPCGIVPVLPLVDSLHMAAEKSLLAEPFDRGCLWAAQTPQVFHRECLSFAFEVAFDEGSTHTDEAGMANRTGATVITALGNASNFKITFEYDLMLARAVHAYSQTESVRRPQEHTL
ncbi:2-C-methyl-D-erythritol 4-phosphate cytidylyltransferase [Streptomyces vinaceus]|nr:2-C-methyl-D-erythritol 4-phosphate cytidylyltransferase [Streptomyces vinaceus]